jgi:hypothetical protein
MPKAKVIFYFIKSFDTIFLVDEKKTPKKRVHPADEDGNDAQGVKAVGKINKLYIENKIFF